VFSLEFINIYMLIMSLIRPVYFPAWQLLHRCTARRSAAVCRFTAVGYSATAAGSVDELSVADQGIIHAVRS